LRNVLLELSQREIDFLIKEMFLAKLCGVLETDIDGLHNELSRIPNIRVFERKNVFTCDGEFRRSANTYTVRNNDYIYILVVQLTDVYETTLVVKKKVSVKLVSEWQEFITVSDKEAETLFLELIAKRIVRVKSARN
jgi:hypothetical protein